MSAATIITLANGKGIDLLDPLATDIDFNVIAEHLAKEKRYNGATPGVEYSVAEHCCRGADALLKSSGNATLAAYFLLHDAHEATLKDDTTPKKRAFAELAEQHFGLLADHVMQTFSLLEYRQDAAIHAVAGLEWPPQDPAIVAQVKVMDLVMFVTEWRDLMPGFEHPNWAPYANVAPLPDTIQPWDWETARRAYITRCMRLLPALQKKLAIVGAA